MKTLAHQYELARCKKALTFAEFQTLTPADLAGYIAEPKLDGRRYALQVRPNGAKHNYVTSRRVSVTTKLMVEKQDSLKFFRDCAFGRRDSVFDGEFIHPEGGTSHETATAIAEDFAVFNIFDVLRWDGKDMREEAWWSRHALLKKLAENLPDRIRVVPCSSRPKSLLAAIREIDGEGIVLKDPNAIYGEGWIKVVAEEFFDVVVVGFEWSTSDRYGSRNWIRGVKFAQWTPHQDSFPLDEICSQRSSPHGKLSLVRLGQTSGFTEKERAAISADPDKYMGRVMILRAKGREASGALRHPRFHGWHADKNPNECTWRV